MLTPSDSVNFFRKLCRIKNLLSKIANPSRPFPAQVMLLAKTEFFASALLFDMDGTLLDSHAATVRAYSTWAQQHGLDTAHVLRESQGRRTRDSLRFLAPKGANVETEIEAVMQQEREDTEGIVEIAGARALLSSIAPNRWAVVTSADEVLARSRIRAAGLPIPSVLVTADDVYEGKPSPFGYLLAAKRLGVAAEDCLVFEDAPAGIAAGVAAGATVIAIASRLMQGRLGGQPHLVDWTAVSVDMNGEQLIFRVS